MEKAILVGIKFKNNPIPFTESLDELKKLAQTAGAKPVNTITQNRDRPDYQFFIGKGKAEDLKALCEKDKADLVIFDHTLSPAQTRNLEEILNLKVIDRTELILDIFALHAQTREGKLQVELAQLNFTLSHLTGQGTMLSRLGGGIGTRGPGETKLEVDRRKVREKISSLKRELESVREKRQLLRNQRKSNQIKTAAIIGYTNSGKSTLLNSLTNAGVLSADKLFATLDTVTRRFYLQGKKQTILLTDTVGFISKLPHQLVKAFRATLEETIEADLLIHVIDSSSQYTEHQIEAVYKTLEEMEISDKPILNVFNKTDKSAGQEIRLMEKYQPSISISALNKEGLDKLAGKIEEILY